MKLLKLQFIIGHITWSDLL